MARARARYVCQACGQTSAGWLGRCPGCDAWSTMVEEAAPRPAVGGAAAAARTGGRAATVVPLAEVAESHVARASCGIPELDRALGGGLVRGSLVLVGGDPGIGKSTLLLQAAAKLAAAVGPALYVTAEESAAQVKMRADRLGIAEPRLFIAAETNLDAALAARDTLAPAVMVVDSVQTVGLEALDTAVGSVGQIRAVTHRLMQAAKASGTAIFVVGHVTKEGAIAGPKVMEHMVDTVLYFEGERGGPYRILRAHKNRFGSAQEVGVFAMEAGGLVGVANPSALFLSQRGSGPGTAVVPAVSGSRPLLLEVQALATPAFGGGTPRRTTTGFEPQRVAMLCAVLHARAGIDLSGMDVFVNVAGGVRLAEPAADLAVLLALASAVRRTALAADAVAVGEVGLAGEVRAAGQLGPRLAEAEAMGFAQALVPAAEWARLRLDTGLTVAPVRHVREALAACGIAPRN